MAEAFPLQRWGAGQSLLVNAGGNGLAGAEDEGCETRVLIASLGVRVLVEITGSRSSPCQREQDSVDDRPMVTGMAAVELRTRHGTANEGSSTSSRLTHVLVLTKKEHQLQTYTK